VGHLCELCAWEFAHILHTPAQPDLGPDLEDSSRIPPGSPGQHPALCGEVSSPRMGPVKEMWP
jgi:hypothetical protein